MSVEILEQQEKDTFQLFEDQDRLIIDGITMLSTRLNAFYDLLKENCLDLPASFRKEQQAWMLEYKQMHHLLTNWEIANLGKQTFSSAFELVIDYIMTAKAKTEKSVQSKTTDLQRVRQFKSDPK